MRGLPIPDRDEDFTADPAELFFDLSFVFAFSRLVFHLIENPDWRGAMEFALLFSLVWFAWAQFTWALNAVAGNSRPMRLILVFATAVCVPMGGSLATAFDEGGAAFGISLAVLLLMPVVTNLVVLADDPELRASSLRLAIPELLAVGLVVAGGFVDDGARVACWVAAVVVILAMTVQAGSSEWLVRPGHFAERHGLIVIVALGEVIVAVGAPVVDALGDGESLGGREIAALTAAGLFAGLLWWSYFDRPLPALEHGHNLTEDALSSGRYARDVYTYGHYPIVAGILLSAAALEEITVHPGVALPGSYRLMLLSGIGLFFLGIAASIARAFSVLALERLLAIGLLAGLIALAADIPGVWLLIAIDVLVIVVLVYEHYRVEVQQRSVSIGTKQSTE